MNPAYKHLETKLRIADMTLLQWGGVVLGVAIGVGWGMYLSPFGPYLSLFTAIYVGGLPVLLAFLSTQAEFDLGVRLKSMVRWRRGADRYVPGPGASAAGYRLDPEPVDAREKLREDLPDLDPAALWG